MFELGALGVVDPLQELEGAVAAWRGIASGAADVGYVGIRPMAGGSIPRHVHATYVDLPLSPPAAQRSMRSTTQAGEGQRHHGLRLDRGGRPAGFGRARSSHYIVRRGALDRCAAGTATSLDGAAYESPAVIVLSPA